MKVALIGPNADNRYNMLGDYTAPQEEENVKTVLDGIRAKLSSSQVEYVKGCSIRDTVTSDIEQAVAAAQRSEVVIAVVGAPVPVISKPVIKKQVRPLLIKRQSAIWNVVKASTVQRFLY